MKSAKLESLWLVVSLFLLLVFQYNIASAQSEKGGAAKGSDCQATMDGDSSEVVEAPKKRRRTTLRQRRSKGSEEANPTATEENTASQVGQVPSPKYNLVDFLTEDPAINPVAQHPWSVIPAGQKYAHVLSHLKPRVVLDPLYKIQPVQIHPVFAGEVEGTNRQIIGQYEAVSELVSWIKSAARGDDSGKMIMFIGPSGTGKTELLSVLDHVSSSLGKRNTDFFEFTYEWQGLENVPGATMLVPRFGGTVLKSSIPADMPRSPFTLLREDIQEDILALHGDEVESKTGYPLDAWMEPDAKSLEIIGEIMKHEYPEVDSGEKDIDELTKEEYIDALSKYVRVVRKKVDPNKTNIVRAVPENPDFSQLFISENPMLMTLPMSSSLRYQFSGKILSQDGRGLLMDEIFRNDPNLLNTLLEISQNQMAETDIGPAVHLNVVPAMTSNDESIDSAKEDGDLKALLDRSHMVPMRLNLHPHEISKTALLMLKAKNFQMQKLELNGKGQLPEPTALKLNEVYPLPEKDGSLKGLAGRMAIYYTGDRSQRILIAPHVMEMMGITAAATRLVTSPEEIKPFMSELQVVGPQSHFYTSIKSRLGLILGREDGVEPAVRADLYKLRFLLREGQQGISSRDIESWFKAAIGLAIDSGQGVLTLAMLDRALIISLDSGTISPGNQNLRAEWLNRYRLVKLEFILKALHDDIRKIVSGDGERAERLYDVVEREIVALAENPSALEWQPDDGSPAQAINKVRLGEIYKKFSELHGRSFSNGFLMSHLNKVSRSQNREKLRNPELMAAISAYLVEAEVDITETTRTIAEFYDNKNQDPEVQKKVTEAESRMARYGYDRKSFQEAISYWSHLIYQKNKAQTAQRQR